MTRLLLATLATVTMSSLMLLYPVRSQMHPEGFKAPSDTKPLPTIENKPHATYEPLSVIPISPQQYVQVEAQKYGWGEGAEWSALVTLINNESGWRPHVINEIGACGLFQALPCSKLGAPVENISNQAAWGLRYIRDRYGSPSSALSQWYSRSPHWY